MKVILQQDVKKLGKKGDIVEVSEGYGRTFLLPRKAAVPATSQNLNVANAQAGSKARKEAMAADEAKLMAKQLEKVEGKSPVRIGDGGKLFGSVTGKDVSDALKKQHIEAIEMLNNEWQDFLCGLMPEEHSDEAESGTSDTEAQENTADMPELRERVNAIAKELMEILDKKQ